MARTATILDEIIARKRVDVERTSAAVSAGRLEEKARKASRTRSFAGSLSTPGVSIIAEIKRASPSAGVFGAGLDAAATARSYERGGAAAISVLTDEPFFQGSDDDLIRARNAVALPVLRKDFIFSEYQVVQCRAMGADAVLLIAAVVDDLPSLAIPARAHCLDILVEVHNEDELDRAIEAGPDMIGINNRDLATFVTDLAVTERLRPRVPTGIPVISESGIKGPSDVRVLRDLGVDAVLVGETLIRDPSPSNAVKALVEAGSVERG